MVSNTIFNWIQISSIRDKCFNYMSKLTKYISANPVTVSSVLLDRSPV